MSVKPDIQNVGNVDTARLQAKVQPLGRELAESFQTLFKALPTATRKPTTLARQLKLSRVTIGALLNAIEKPDPYDVLVQVPGPESLRAFTRAASGMGVDSQLVERANATVDGFASIIRNDFGTRSAFNAAITAQSPELAKRFENTGRYKVFMGMRQILGVEADAWFTSMMFAPSAESQDDIAITTIHGSIGMRRLRPDVDVYFTFGPPPQDEEISESGVATSPLDLQEFYTHDPAPLETEFAHGQLVHRLVHDRLGRKATVDMLAVGFNSRGSKRYATPERPRGGAVVFPDVPVKTLVCDAIVHDDIFPDAEPELLVYNPGGRGPANPCDPRRDIDRVNVPEKIQALGKAADRFQVTEVPNYQAMVNRVTTHMGYDPAKFRVFRLRMVYPVHGFQVVMAFDAPPKPEV